LNADGLLVDGVGCEGGGMGVGPGAGDGTGCDGTGCEGGGMGVGPGGGVGPGAGDGPGAGVGPGAGDGAGAGVGKIWEGTGFDGVICPEIFKATIMPMTVRESSIRIILLFINQSIRRCGENLRLYLFCF